MKRFTGAYLQGFLADCARPEKNSALQEFVRGFTPVLRTCALSWPHILFTVSATSAGLCWCSHKCCRLSIRAPALGVRGQLHDVLHRQGSIMGEPCDERLQFSTGKTGMQVLPGTALPYCTDCSPPAGSGAGSLFDRQAREDGAGQHKGHLPLPLARCMLLSLNARANGGHPNVKRAYTCKVGTLLVCACMCVPYLHVPIGKQAAVLEQRLLPVQCAAALREVFVGEALRSLHNGGCARALGVAQHVLCRLNSSGVAGGGTKTGRASTAPEHSICPSSLAHVGRCT